MRLCAQLIRLDFDVLKMALIFAFFSGFLKKANIYGNANVNFLMCDLLFLFLFCYEICSSNYSLNHLVHFFFSLNKVVVMKCYILYVCRHIIIYFM